MQHVLYIFGATTTLIVAIRTAAELATSVNTFGSRSRGGIVVEGLYQLIVPLAAFAAATIIGELSTIRRRLEGTADFTHEADKGS